MRSLQKVSEYLGIGLGIVLLVWLSTSLDRALNPLEKKYASSKIQLVQLPKMLDQNTTTSLDSVLISDGFRTQSSIAD